MIFIKNLQTILCFINTDMNIFSTFDYKKFLRAQVDAHGSEYGYKSKLAEAAGCQKSFFSQVLNSHVHLTPEQALGLAKYWKLLPRERDYFLGLVNYGRAGTEELANHLKEKLVELKRETENLTKRYSSPNLSARTDFAAIYYSSWHYAAIHILVTIPQFQTPPKIAKRLHLPDSFVLEVLRQLQKIEVVTKKSDGSWQATSKSLHIGRDSVFNSMNHAHWRQRASESSLQNKPESVHYTGVYSMSLDDLTKLRETIFELIDRSRQLVAPSPEEELVCMNCDLFVV